jgi:uncharacterized protein YjiK
MRKKGSADLVIILILLLMAFFIINNNESVGSSFFGVKENLNLLKWIDLLPRGGGRLGVEMSKEPVEEDLEFELIFDTADIVVRKLDEKIQEFFKYIDDSLYGYEYGYGYGQGYGYGYWEGHGYGYGFGYWDEYEYGYWSIGGTCGDGIINGNEKCDGSAYNCLEGETCENCLCVPPCVEEKGAGVCECEEDEGVKIPRVGYQEEDCINGALEPYILRNYKFVEKRKLPINSESSGLADGGKDTLYVIHNDPENVSKVNIEYDFVETFSLEGFEDTEGITPLGGEHFAIVEERKQDISIIDLSNKKDGDTVYASNSPKYELGIGSAPNNDGLEGICYDEENNLLYAAKENPRSDVDPIVYKVDLVNMEISLLFSFPSAKDLSGCYFAEETGNIYLASHEEGTLFRVDLEDGSIIEELSFDLNQFEGVTFLNNGELLAGIGEPNSLVLYELKECEEGGTSPGGNGVTEEDEFPKYISISTCEELQNIGLNENYKLVNDIDCSDTINWNNGLGFDPIGKVGEFNGKLEGNGYHIYDLYIKRPSENYVGLFGRNNGEIRNLKLVDSRVEGRSLVGSLVGLNKGEVEKIIVNNYGEDKGVFSFFYSGGLVGYNYNSGKILGSKVYSNIKSRYYSAGIVSYNRGIVEKSSYGGILDGTYYSGGIFGYNNGDGIKNNIVESLTIDGFRAGLLGGYSRGNVQGIISDNVERGNLPCVNNVNSGEAVCNSPSEIKDEESGEEESGESGGGETCKRYGDCPKDQEMDEEGECVCSNNKQYNEETERCECGDFQEENSQGVCVCINEGQRVNEDTGECECVQKFQELNPVTGICQCEDINMIIGEDDTCVCAETQKIMTGGESGGYSCVCPGVVCENTGEGSCDESQGSVDCQDCQDHETGCCECGEEGMDCEETSRYVCGGYDESSGAKNNGFIEGDGYVWEVEGMCNSQACFDIYRLTEECPECYGCSGGNYNSEGILTCDVPKSVGSSCARELTDLEKIFYGGTCSGKDGDCTTCGNIPCELSCQYQDDGKFGCISEDEVCEFPQEFEESENEEEENSVCSGEECETCNLCETCDESCSTINEEECDYCDSDFSSSSCPEDDYLKDTSLEDAPETCSTGNCPEEKTFEEALDEELKNLDPSDPKYKLKLLILEHAIVVQEALTIAQDGTSDYGNENGPINDAMSLVNDFIAKIKEPSYGYTNLKEYNDILIESEMLIGQLYLLKIQKLADDLEYEYEVFEDAKSNINCYGKEYLLPITFLVEFEEGRGFVITKWKFKQKYYKDIRANPRFELIDPEPPFIDICSKEEGFPKEYTIDGLSIVKGEHRDLIGYICSVGGDLEKSKEKIKRMINFDSKPFYPEAYPEYSDGVDAYRANGEVILKELSDKLKETSPEKYVDVSILIGKIYNAAGDSREAINNYADLTYLEVEDVGVEALGSAYINYAMSVASKNPHSALESLNNERIIGDSNVDNFRKQLKMNIIDAINSRYSLTEKNIFDDIEEIGGDGGYYFKELNLGRVFSKKCNTKDIAESIEGQSKEIENLVVGLKYIKFMIEYDIDIKLLYSSSSPDEQSNIWPAVEKVIYRIKQELISSGDLDPDDYTFWDDELCEATKAVHKLLLTNLDVALVATNGNIEEAEELFWGIRGNSLGENGNIREAFLGDVKENPYVIEGDISDKESEYDISMGFMFTQGAIGPYLDDTVADSWTNFIGRDLLNFETALYFIVPEVVGGIAVPARITKVFGYSQRMTLGAFLVNKIPVLRNIGMACGKSKSFFSNKVLAKLTYGHFPRLRGFFAGTVIEGGLGVSASFVGLDVIADATIFHSRASDIAQDIGARITREFMTVDKKFVQVIEVPDINNLPSSLGESITFENNLFEGQVVKYYKTFLEGENSEKGILAFVETGKARELCPTSEIFNELNSDKLRRIATASGLGGKTYDDYSKLYRGEMGDCDVLLTLDRNEVGDFVEKVYKKGKKISPNCNELIREVTTRQNHGLERYSELAGDGIKNGDTVTTLALVGPGCNGVKELKGTISIMETDLSRYFEAKEGFGGVLEVGKIASMGKEMTEKEIMSMVQELIDSVDDKGITHLVSGTSGAHAKAYRRMFNRKVAEGEIAAEAGEKYISESAKDGLNIEDLGDRPIKCKKEVKFLADLGEDHFVEYAITVYDIEVIKKIFANEGTYKLENIERVY